MKRTLFLIAILSGCGTPAQKKPEPKPLITRQAPPLVQRPTKVSGTLFEVTEDVFAEVEKLVEREAPSAEVDSLTGIRWADGTQSIFAAHVRFPPDDMSETDYERVIDEAKLERCEAEFEGCLDDDSCTDGAYDSCVESAYRDRFVYMSAHHGIDCGVYEVSRLSVEGSAIVVVDRRVIDAMVCDFDLPTVRPSAQDLDLDGGPELVYAWSSNQPVVLGDGDVPRKTSIVVLDANSLDEQLRWEETVADDPYAEVHQYHGLQEVKRADGYVDLWANSVKTVGYCLDSDWALGPAFVRPVDGPDDEACEVTASQRFLRYDIETDSWQPDEQQQPETP